MPNKLKVLLVDDHALVRRGFRRMLEDEPSFQIVGEASDGLEAIERASELRPDVIVMDCALPQVSGIEASRQILQKQPNIGILMLSMHSEDTLVRQALDAGAKGYILKNAMDLDLVSAIKKIAAGNTVLDPQLSRSQALKGERDAGLTPRLLRRTPIPVSRPDGRPGYARKGAGEESPGSMDERCRITSGGGNPRDSATENRPPRRVAFSRGKGETVR